jgi:periplasmic protein TonB
MGNRYGNGFIWHLTRSRRSRRKPASACRWQGRSSSSARTDISDLPGFANFLKANPGIKSTFFYMEPNQIKDADILDILFEGRNKDYGAYELRKTYNQRIKKAMTATGAVVGLLCIGYFVAGGTKGRVRSLKDDGEVVLVAVEPDKVVPPVIPPPRVAPQPVATRIFTTPVIVKTEVKPDEKPPAQDELDQVKIGTANVKGAADDGIAAPPVSDGGKGVVEAPKKQEDDDGLFTKVEIESSFPGGTQAWARFLNKNLHYPDEAISGEIQGIVMVQFIVDKDGHISDAMAISGPENGGLREEAIRVIKKSGQWVPAQQNGRYVKSYKRQPVIFQIGTE